MSISNIYEYLKIIYFSVIQVISLRIPENLIDCYRGNETIQFSASTLQTFIDLIKKIENSFANGIDIRHLSVRLLHE